MKRRITSRIGIWTISQNRADRSNQYKHSLTNNTITRRRTNKQAEKHQLRHLNNKQETMKLTNQCLYPNLWCTDKMFCPNKNPLSILYRPSDLSKKFLKREENPLNYFLVNVINPLQVPKPVIIKPPSHWETLTLFIWINYVKTIELNQHLSSKLCRRAKPINLKLLNKKVKIILQILLHHIGSKKNSHLEPETRISWLFGKPIA